MIMKIAGSWPIRCLNAKRQKLLSRRYSISSDPSNELQVDEVNNICSFGLNRPNTRNALGKNLLHQLSEQIKRLRTNMSTRVVVIHSLVPGAFCSGADLKERASMPIEDVGLHVSAARNLLHELSVLPQPIIAAIDGLALGGGLEMALACDIRIAATTAKMGLVEAKLGIIPGAGGTLRLPRIVGASIAKEMIFSGRVIDGSEAKQIGLVNHAVQQNTNQNAAYVRSMQLAEEIAQNGPLAIQAAKLSIDKGMQSADLNVAMSIEEACYANIIPTKDRLEGLIAFKEKRPPVFKGE